jgi:hypothetical protein
MGVMQQLSGSWFRRVSGLAAGLALAGCQGPAKVPAPERITLSASDKGDRRSVAVTVYNQSFGVVRETRRLKLGSGRVELSFKDVAAHIQPETVRLRSQTKGALFEVLEQSYRYDLLTPAKLLEKHVGKPIAVYRYNEQTGAEERKTAEVLSVEGGVTLRIDGEVTTQFQGRYAFADVPPNLLDKPTLVWSLLSDRATQDVEVTYLTQNLGWRADYVLKLDSSDRRADLNGWVTLDNRSGTSYEQAALRLVAGDVNRVQPAASPELAREELAEAQSDDSPSFKQEGLFEYHLYSLERPTTLLDRETKQVSLLAAENVGVVKKLVFNGEPHFYRGSYGPLVQNRKVGVLVELTNSAENGLGMPLPRGTVRLYKADASGALQLVGEDAIDHTARDEKLTLKVGEAFDIVGDRKQTEWKQLGSCSAEGAFETELRNHKDREVSIEMNEPAGAEWQILQNSHPFEKVDAGTFRFVVKVPARGTTRVTYRIFVRYC